MPKQDPVLSAPNSASVLNIGSAKLVHRISSQATHGAFSLVEFVSEPGEGVGLHVHEHEEELVYLLEGQIEVTLGDQSMAVLMPGRLDEFFVGLDKELGTDRAHEEGISRLCAAYGLTFVD